MDRDELHYAALENDVEQVKSLLSAGVSPDVRDKASWTPLHFAAQDNALDAAKVLVDAGADVNAQDEHGNDPLSNAVFNNPPQTENYFPIIKFLLVSGADPKQENNHGASTLSVVDQVAWNNPTLKDLFKDHLPAN
ncbi:ankyrin repeat domain-containing protein [Gordonia sp. DT101]|uniref:ankyrin repeat domain-containing protein n=1 Tax=Gordonia sp. DT101 TaxID=3416545 RepID=UPI003CF2FD09